MASLNPPFTTFAGKRIWLVGASSGIGAATARLLLARRARVALSARSAHLLQAMAANARCLGQDALALPLDACDAQAVQAAVTGLLGQWGGLDLVILAAGVFHPMNATELDLAACEQVIQVNLLSVYRALGAVLPVLTRQGAGALAVIASSTAYSGLPLCLAYGPSKAALLNLCETLYLDLRPRGIGVHVIVPGFVDTPLIADHDFPRPALIRAEEAACRLLDGIARGAFEIHFPRRYTQFLKLLRLLPYRWYFPLVHWASAMLGHRDVRPGMPAAD